jgi:hypothetical protein
MSSKALALSIPFLFYGLYEAQSKKSCWFFSSSPSLTKNKIDGRISTVEYPSNNPIEDRMVTYQLTSVNGYAAAVFDGHGGWQMVTTPSNSV